MIGPLSSWYKNDLLKVRMLLAEFNQLEGSGPFGELTHKDGLSVDVQR